MGSKRNDFLEGFAIKQRELGQTQQSYKKLIDSKITTRIEKIRASNVKETIESLTQERNDLRAQLWVSEGVCHKKVNDQQLKQIRCLVECQENLSEDISKLREGLKNVEREISRANKDVIRLNNQTVPDSRQQAHAERVRKKMSLLATKYESSVARECGLARENAKIREKIFLEISLREVFNHSYGKKIQCLTSDRKYLLELIEYAFGIFENGINAYEKLENQNNKGKLEMEQHKKDAQARMRVACTEQEGGQFVQCKCKKRDLADLQPKEYRRREKFRKEHVKKLNLYRKIFDQIKAYTDSEDIASVIEKFKEQESLYYSYFTYANELGYHLTLVNSSVSRLFTDITQLLQDNENTLEGQLTTIYTLEKMLQDKQKKNELLTKRKNDKDQIIEKLLQDIQEIFEASNADFSPIEALLGDQTHINLMNVRNVMKVFEQRLIDIIACVYVSEHKDDKMSYGNFCVQDVEKVCENPTPLDEIVLTQQCPECGEGDAYQDDVVALAVKSREEVKEKLYEKITQPEMQYRLHTLSQCRLPRSRFLVAKRNM